jgi:hypothetical protein
VRDRRNVEDVLNFETKRIERSNRRVATRPGAFYFHIELFHPEFLGGTPTGLGCDLGSKWSTLPGTPESCASRRCPTKRVAMAVTDGDYRIVERRMNMRDPLDHVLLDFRLGTLFCYCLCHIYPGLLLDRTTRTLSSTRIGLGVLPPDRKATAMTQTPVTAKIHESFYVHRYFASQVTLNLQLRNLATESVRFFFRQLGYFRVSRDPDRVTNHLCGVSTDSEN